MSYHMPNSAEWIAMLMQERELATQNEVAAWLHVTKQSVHQWAHGKNQMDAASATRVAIALGINPLFVIGSCAYHQANSDAKRSFWRTALTPVEPKTLAEVKRRRSKKTAQKPD